MNVVFMGSDKIAIGVLEFLKAHAKRLIVVSQPDRPSGRGQKMTPNAVSDWALQNNIELLRPEKLDDVFFNEIKDFSPDLSFVMAYGRILKQPVIDLPRLGTWNFHASLLPYLRGASPIETSIALGEKTTGVALMKMVFALDAGPVADVEQVIIENRMTALELREAVGRSSVKVLEKNWPALSQGVIKITSQKEEQATYCRILTKDDAWLDPSASAAEIVHRIRAFGKNIGSLVVHGDERLKILGAQVFSEAKFENNMSGTIVETSPRFVMAAGQGYVELLELQRAGGKALGAREFLNGYPLKTGDRLLGRPHRLLVDSKPFPRGY